MTWLRDWLAFILQYIRDPLFRSVLAGMRDLHRGRFALWDEVFGEEKRE